jgi:hypothetical protein
VTVTLGADDVCDAVTATLIAGLPAALERNRAQGGLDLDVPAATDMPTEEALLEGAGLVLPSFVVSSPGLADQPVRHGDGTYTATWAVVVTVFAHGASYGDTARRSRQYAKAVRSALVLQQALGGIASGVEWTGEEYDRIDARDARTLGGCFVGFGVTLDDVLDDSGTDIPVSATDLTTDLLPAFGEDLL